MTQIRQTQISTSVSSRGNKTHCFPWGQSLSAVIDVFSHLCEVLRYQEAVEGNLLPLLQFATDQLLSPAPQIPHLGADNEKRTNVIFRGDGAVSVG